MLIGEIMAATGVVSFFTEQLLELPLKFLTESFGNLIQAFIWPLPLLEFSPPWGIAILAVIYLVFANFIKKPLEQWLFENGD